MSLQWRSTTGSALVVVMLLLAMIATLTAVVARSISAAAVELGTARATVLADHDVRAGVELAVAAILKLGEDMRIADTEAVLNDRRIAVHITNERGRIDLNKASPTVLDSMFRSSGIDSGEAAALTAALVDWRGGSPSQKLAPAASNKALGLGAHLAGLSQGDTPVEAGASGSPSQTTIGTRYFFHPAQLSSIPGFTTKIVKSILPIVTVASGSAQIDPFVASARTLAAMPDISESKAESFIEVRNSNTNRTTALLQLGLDKALVTDSAAPAWRLQVMVKDRLGRSRVHEVVIAMVEGDQKPYRILYASEQVAG